MDYRFYEEVNEVIQREPGEGQEPEILGQLAAIGIKKGQPFKPDARMQKILKDAADVAAVTVRALASRPREDMFYYYPGKSFWSLTLYDNQTRAMLQTDQQFSGIDMNKKDLVKNADGGVTLYFGPKVPKGLETNWIPTSGKKPYAMFRFYGPEEEFYNKNFKLADVELVK